MPKANTVKKLIPVDLFQRINKNSKGKVKETVNCT